MFQSERRKVIISEARRLVCDTLLCPKETLIFHIQLVVSLVAWRRLGPHVCHVCVCLFVT
jgi:hypothetical protein